MWPLGQSLRQLSFCLKFLYIIGFENARMNKQERHKENAATDSNEQEKMSKNTKVLKVLNQLRMA